MMKRITIIMIATLIGACGGGSSPSGSTVSADAVATSAAPTQTTTAALDARAKYWEPMIRSEDYTGQLAVMFKEAAGVRLNAGTHALFRSRSNADIAALNALFAQHPEAAVQMGLPNITQDELDQRIAEIRVSEGYPMTDWGSFYIINVMDPDEALEILNGLVTLSGAKNLVWFVHPIPRAYPAGIQIPNINPGPGQDYLKDVASTGGLNVKAAWDAGLDGTGIIVRDQEVNWNINHLDLPLSDASFYSKAPANTNPAYKNDKYVQHGTSVAGIVVGKNNSMGITGIAPNSVFQLGQDPGSYFPANDIIALLVTDQTKYADGTSPPGMPSPKIKPGDIFLIEVQDSKPGSKLGCDIPQDQYVITGCVPIEAFASIFFMLKDIVNYGGIVVVEGSGNGSVNLDVPSNTLINDGGSIIDLSKDNSGAIMVGASMGGSTLMNGKHTLEKAPFSNCGSRVDVFAWGAGVVTTGGGDHPISVKGDPNQAYTAQFGGVSAAAALISGSASLLQQYAKQLYKDPKSACAIKSWEYIYLSSQQMRDVMVKSGTAPKPYTPDSQLWNGYQDPNPGCNIGVQPDLAKAMQIIKDGCEGKAGGIKATVKTKDLTTYCPKATLQNPNPKKESWCPDYGPLQPAIGKMMDLDGDGRADLISWSRDRKWYVDLSSTGPTQFSGMTFPKGKPKDNFGYWDLVFDLSGDTTIAKDAMIFPVVMDYNTDGKADLALYDSIHGKWYVSFTTGNTLNTNNAVNDINPWPGWTMTLDYSSQPNWKPYSRPVPGDYDGQDNDPYTFDHYMDLALQTPDGWWLIDSGGANIKANYGAFDQTINYLTEAQLNEAPGWAWLPIVYLTSYGYADIYGTSIEIKTPDSVPYLNKMNRVLSWSNESKKFSEYDGNDYGTNEIVYTQAKFQTKSYADLGLKKQYPDFGLWQVATIQSGWADFINIDPYVNFGGIECYTIPGDYDGDGYDDRAVQCGNTWRIAYTGSTYPINYNQKSTVTLDGKQQILSETFRLITEPQPQDPLPGYVYPGGVSFKDIKDIFGTVNYLCPTVKPTGNTPPCNLLNMTPAPVGPYFPQCVDAVRKTYAPDTCTNPAKKVTCEQMRVKQAQCVYQ